MRAWLLLIAGCGRFGFDNAPGAVGDVGPQEPCTEPWSAPRPVEYGGTTVSPSGPTITADDLELYFDDGADLWVMRRTRADLPFDAPVALPSPPTTMEPDAAPSISADGLDLYFTRTFMSNALVMRSQRASRSAPFEAIIHVGPYGGGDISSDRLTFYSQDYMTGIQVQTRSSPMEMFGPRVDLLPPVNDAQSTNVSPSISTDGLELYFVSDRSGVFRIHVARRDSPGVDFTSVEQIAAGDDPREPEISADGRRLYFVEQIQGARVLSVMSRCD